MIHVYLVTYDVFHIILESADTGAVKPCTAEHRHHDMQHAAPTNDTEQRLLMPPCCA